MINDGLSLKRIENKVSCLKAGYLDPSWVNLKFKGNLSNSFV